MGVQIDLPASFKLQLDAAGAIKLPEFLIKPDKTNHPHLARGGIDIGVVAGPNVADSWAAEIQAAYLASLPAKDKLVKVPIDGYPVRATPFKPKNVPTPGMTLQLRVTVKFFNSNNSGDPVNPERTSETYRCVLEAPAKAEGQGAGDAKSGKPLLRVEPLTLLISDRAGAVPLTVYVDNPTPNVAPVVTLQNPSAVPAKLLPFIQQLIKPGLRRVVSLENQDIYELQLVLRLDPNAERELQAQTETKPLSIALRTELPKGPGVDHALNLDSSQREHPGWMAIDLGTSNSTVTLYDPARPMRAEGLAHEQEDRLRDLLERWFRATGGDLAGVNDERWIHLLEEVSGRLGGTGAPVTAQGARTRLIAALGRDATGTTRLYDVVRGIEICVSRYHNDEPLRRAAIRRLNAIYHEALQVPPLESKCFYPIVLDLEYAQKELPSEMEVKRLGQPLDVIMGLKAQTDRLKAIAEAKSEAELETIKERFHHSPKRYLGKGKVIQVHVDGNGQLVSSDALVQAGWKKLRDLTDDYRADCIARRTILFSKGPFRSAIVTYPTVAPPQVRQSIGKLVRDLGFTFVQTDYDEAVSAAIFYLYREFGGSLDLGIDALKARCHTSGGKWWMNCMVLDVGGGTTDVALLRLTLEDKTPVSKEGKGGRYFVITPELRGSSGHMELGGELVTLNVFRTLKLLIADRAMSLLQEKKLSDPRLEDLRRNKIGEPFVVKNEYKKNSLVEASAGDRPKAFNAADHVIPTRWNKSSSTSATTPKNLLNFTPLWEEAEKAKLYFGSQASLETAAPYPMSGADVQKMLIRAGIKAEGLNPADLVVSLDRRQFQAAAEPIVQEAVGLAQALLKSKLSPNNERLDWLILSGGTCNLNLLHQHIRREFINSKDFVWNPERVTFEPKFAKLATSVGACYAEQLRQLRFSPADWDGTYNSLYFDVKNLFYFLPCAFVLQAQDLHALEIFKANLPLHQLDDEPLGKARSKVFGSQLSSLVRRKDFDSDPGKLWGKFNGQAMQQRLGISEHVFTDEYKIQFEVDHRLNIRAMVWRGRAQFTMEQNVPSLDLAKVMAAPAPTPAKGAPASPRTPVTDPGFPEWEIALNVEQALASDGPSSGTVLFAAEPRVIWDTFIGADGKEARGLVSTAEVSAFPESDRHRVHARRKGEKAWIFAGEITRPGARPEYPALYTFTLDDKGILRVHRGCVPYRWAATIEEVKDKPGTVWRQPLQTQEPETDDSDRNPFNGLH